jgi:hypothetical protein
MPIKSLGFTGDCNNIMDYGWYRITSGVVNGASVGANSWLLCLTHPNPEYYLVQWIFPRGTGERLYRREKSVGVWGDWYYIEFTNKV